MKYYSTNHQTPDVTLQEASCKRTCCRQRFIYARAHQYIADLFLRTNVTDEPARSGLPGGTGFFGEDIPADKLKQIVYDTMSFDIPLVKVSDNIYSLELFHGPTLAFKDVGARFMARMLGYFVSGQEKLVNVLVATSGDTGSAVANGFLGVEGIHVYVLYPKGKVSLIQEKQFTTLGKNVTALEVDGPSTIVSD